MLASQLELLVDWEKDAPHALEHTLEQLRSLNGVQSAKLIDGALVIESTLPSSELLTSVEKLSGRRTVLQGFGEKQSAVAQVGGDVIGVIRFQQSTEGPLVVDGTVDGLMQGTHMLCVHEAGDLSRGCESVGHVYGGAGGPGELGTVEADEGGRATFRILRDNLQIWEIIGRSLVVSTSPKKAINGNGGQKDPADWSQVKKMGCGVIARSAGVFSNPKRVCACDGVVVWDERDRPAAGAGRRAPQPEPRSCCGGKHSSL